MQWIRTHIGHFPNLCIMLSERRTQMAQNFNEKKQHATIISQFFAGQDKYCVSFGN
jgi:hypothetical protein